MAFERNALITIAEKEEIGHAGDKHDAQPSLIPVYLGLILFVAAMVASVMIFGLPGLYIPAVALVPVIFLMLIRISLG